MAIVCVTLFGTIAYRTRMSFILAKDPKAKSQATIIITITSAIMNLLCSIILSQFYYWIARKLTDFGKELSGKILESLTLSFLLKNFISINQNMMIH